LVEIKIIMLNSSLIKSVSSLLVIMGVIYLSYSYVTRPLVEVDTTSSIEVTSSDTDISSSTTQNLANVFTVLLEKLSAVDFQGSNPIFNNPIFQNGLVSFSRDLPDIEKMRANPFAPIEGNPTLYIHYNSPAVTSLTFSTTSSAFPGNTAATTTKK